MTLLALCSLQATSEDATEALRRKHAARKIQRMYRDRKEKMDAAQPLQHAWQNYDMMRKMRARRTIRKGLRHGLARRRRDKNLLKKLIIDPQYGPAVTSGGCALDDALRMKMIAAAKHVWKNPKQYRKKGVTQPVSNKVLARQGLFLRGCPIIHSFPKTK